MSGTLRFAAAQVALALFGAGLAWHPSVRPMSWPGRLAVSFCAGSVFLALEATAYSLLGIPWSVPSLAIPLLALSALSAMAWQRLPAAGHRPASFRSAAARWSIALGALSLIYLAVSLGSTAGTSVDYVLFWGVKAVKYAGNRGIDPAFLRFPFAVHAVTDYPPLVPIVHGWGTLVAGKLPWRVVPLISGLAIAAAIPILFDRCRRLAGDAGAAVLAALWTAAICVSVVHSFSAGGAEPAILLFETAAVAWLLTESEGESRLVPILALCGAALTKVEGLAAVLLIALGSWARDRARGSRREAMRTLALAVFPVAALGLWFLYQRTRGLEPGYRAHGDFLVIYIDQLRTVLRELLRSLNAGSLWIPWAFAAAIVIFRPRSWRAAAPAVVLAAGLLGFLVFDYLHDKDDPSERIGWTSPRVTQSALSAMILAAGALSLSKTRAADPESPPP